MQPHNQAQQTGCLRRAVCHQADFRPADRQEHQVQLSGVPEDYLHSGAVPESFVIFPLSCCLPALNPVWHFWPLSVSAQLLPAAARPVYGLSQADPDSGCPALPEPAPVGLLAVTSGFRASGVSSPQNASALQAQLHQHLPCGLHLPAVPEWLWPHHAEWL